MTRKDQFKPTTAPAGGWGSIKSVARHLHKQGVLKDAPLLAHQNKPGGFMCVSCAWSKPNPPHLAEFCENGAKATAWELTKYRTTPEFFERHTLAELRNWSDYDLEQAGRLTHPMRHDPQTDRYEAIEWKEAFAEIGEKLGQIRDNDPRRAIFYTSGRAALETSYMYQLFARIYGNNNLPDSSNMCHESTSIALPESIGVPVGTVRLEDFTHTDLIIFFGQNVGSNSPRMLHQLKDARERGATIISFNPLRERGLDRFVDPQNPNQMLTSDETKISNLYYQVRAGGDIAAILGICKTLFDLDDDTRITGASRVLDTEFVSRHTDGIADFETYVRGLAWSDLETEAGLTRSDLGTVAKIYARAEKAIAIYGMGLTQHKLGVDTIQTLVNLLLLRGNIGKTGAGICPVRGHSNVQGQRTVGITEKPELAPMDKLREIFNFEPPTEKGYDTIESCEEILAGNVDAFVGLGGNFLRAVPERSLMEHKWPDMALTVQIATKLNRSHLFCGKAAYLLPCLGRLEIDRQASGEQAVSMEDSTSVFHASKGRKKPASMHLLSEPAIVAGIAQATLCGELDIPWQEWVDDYGRIRDAMERTWPDMFADFNRRMWIPGGFEKPVAARERVWNTENGKANFIIPKAINASFDTGNDATVFRLITLRSNDQFNTTVYGYRDRFRGVFGTRMVVFMNPEDIESAGLQHGEEVKLITASDDGVERELGGLAILPYNIPRGCLGAYYPEANVLIPVWQHAEKSHVPAAKSVPVRIVAPRLDQATL